MMLQWSLATGICVSAILGGLLYLMHSSRHF
jgi:hypothetical protein